MPTIANPQFRSAEAAPTRPSASPAAPLRSRIYTVAHRHALTLTLAEGADPASRPELALRARQLTDRRHRRTIARTLRRIVEEAHRPALARANVILIRRGPVLDAEDVLVALASRLDSPAEVRPQGMAQLERVLTNAAYSPLYNPSQPGTLRRQLAAVLSALEPGEPRSHEFPIGR
jgi:hypothetical protein